MQVASHNDACNLNGKSLIVHSPTPATHDHYFHTPLTPQKGTTPPHVPVYNIWPRTSFSLSIFAHPFFDA